MTKKQQLLSEASLIDLSDEDLKEFLGYQYQAWQNMEREKKNDLELKRLKEVAKQYEAEMFSVEIKEAKSKIKAARALCEARGISYKLPEVD